MNRENKSIFPSPQNIFKFLNNCDQDMTHIILSPIKCINYNKEEFKGKEKDQDKDKDKDKEIEKKLQKTELPENKKIITSNADSNTNNNCCTIVKQKNQEDTQEIKSSSGNKNKKEIVNENTTLENKESIVQAKQNANTNKRENKENNHLMNMNRNKITVGINR